ncbi:toprim domain-containing protein [Patescibacteria group bacterium]|nr:toprim domain-containing protein [Patescibacteria group bacterium]
MDSLHRLEEIFSRFPGIGPRQAKRFVYYLLNKSPASIKEFTDLVADVRRSTSECEKCHRFFFHRAQKTDLCPTCADQSRDRSTLMVVARDSDFETVERSGAYKGLYFILGGTVPILDKEPEKRIRLQQLLERASESTLTEIILSLNTTPDGEHTEKIVHEGLAKVSPARITVLGRGLSTGAELEYADSETIKSALQNRRSSL